MKLHHLGIACRDLDHAVRAFEAQGLGRPEGGKVWDPGQEAWVLLMRAADGTCMELVQGPRVEALAKRGIALYHACFLVDDLEAAVAAQLEAGAMLVAAPEPAPLFNGRRVAFVRGEAGLIELLEERAPGGGQG